MSDERRSLQNDELDAEWHGRIIGPTDGRRNPWDARMLKIREQYIAAKAELHEWRKAEADD